MCLEFFMSLSTHIMFRIEDCKYTNQWPCGAIVTCLEQRSKGYGSSVEGPKLATRGGVNGSRSKFLSKSICQPISRKSPQTLKSRIWESSYGLAISKQNALGSETEAITRNPPNSSFTGSDRSGWSGRFQTGQTGFTDRSDRLLPNSTQTKLQILNLEQTKSKSNETWRIPSHLSYEHIPKRSLPKD